MYYNKSNIKKKRNSMFKLNQPAKLQENTVSYTFFFPAFLVEENRCGTINKNWLFTKP